MKKLFNPFLWIVLLVSAHIHLNAQIKNPSASLTLQFKAESGTNATAVAYNPSKNIYYALIGGNATFPLECFDAKGKPLYQAAAGFDSRGMWYNPVTNKLEINGYDQNGIISIPLSEKGYPDTDAPEYLSKTKLQPDPNSCGVLDTDANEILYYYNGVVYRYRRFEYKNKMDLAIPVDVGNINETSMIYTGKKGYELGILDYVKKKVFLFDKSNGKLTFTVELPSSSVTGPYFWFAYANNHAWIYNKNSRTWTGYKIFKK